MLTSLHPGEREGGRVERPHLGLPVDAARDAPQSRGALRTQGDRHPQARQELPPLHVRGLRAAGQEARRRAWRARAREERPRGDPRVEQPPAPGGVLRRPVRGDGAAHHQPSPERGRPRLHHQPRRGPRAAHRRNDGEATRRVQRPGEPGPCLRPLLGRLGAGGLESYEDLLSGADEERFEYPDFDENDAAAMCYTSGTTGRPKGALYSHRAICLHSWPLPWRT